MIEGFDATSYCCLAFHLPRSSGDKFLKACKPLSKWDATRKLREKYLCRFSIEVEGQITFVLKVRNSASAAATQSLNEYRIR